MIEFRPFNQGDVEFIAANMRESDTIEVWNSHGHKPLEALNYAASYSRFGAIACSNGVPLVAFGLVICDVMLSTGCPWLLGTNQAMKYRREFLTESPRIIASMLEMCKHLENYIHVENNNSLRWLRRLGFQFDKPQPFGPFGAEFQRFYMTRGDYV